MKRKGEEGGRRRGTSQATIVDDSGKNNNNGIVREEECRRTTEAAGTDWAVPRCNSVCVREETINQKCVSIHRQERLRFFVFIFLFKRLLLIRKIKGMWG
jgi:hypothetical protein